ncbi:TPA: hypothetical protein DCZ31_03450 [Patescibacteria group bacterium]|nr:hypothetical protein [Candidatus Gracilibacteria bacterium]
MIILSCSQISLLSFISTVSSLFEVLNFNNISLLSFFHASSIIDNLIVFSFFRNSRFEVINGVHLLYDSLFLLSQSSSFVPFKSESIEISVSTQYFAILHFDSPKYINNLS